MSNSTGTLFSISTFGESHGPMIGVCIDGCPAGLGIDIQAIQAQLDRRRPGQSEIVSQRKEADLAQIISGVFEGKSTGMPICILIPNADHKPQDYEHLRDVYRPSHADYSWQKKYGHRDHRGGGRSSARETASRVAAGAVANSLLAHTGINIRAWVHSVGHVVVNDERMNYTVSDIEANVVRCPDRDAAAQMIELIKEVRKDGDTIGGTIKCVVSGVPAGWGAPIYDKLHADLAKAMMSINAAKGFEYGSGFSGTHMRGSQQNDIFYTDKGEIRTRSNHSGGIQGGVSNGETIYFRVAFKAVATLMHEQQTVNIDGEEVTIKGKGRHDPCVLPRAVPVVEAMAALTLADHYLLSLSNRMETI